MAKKGKSNRSLTFVDIVMGAEADVIKAAYEARVKIDELLAEREEAYRRIDALERQVDEVVGTPGAFAFPPPPVPVAGFSKKTASKRSVPKSGGSTGTSGGGSAASKTASGGKKKSRPEGAPDGDASGQAESNREQEGADSVSGSAAEPATS